MSLNIVLLSGGSGKRLWPLSNDVRSKQFLKVLRGDDGAPCSMVQRTFAQLKKTGIPKQDGSIIVATGENQIHSLQSQLQDCSYSIVAEPSRRDTLPAILLACSYLSSVQHKAEDDTVVVMPIDSYVESAYYQNLEMLEVAVQTESYDLLLLGVKPAYPSEKYGYINPGVFDCPQTGKALPVKSFCEKPSSDLAQSLIVKGALWNCGVFAFKLGYIKNIAIDVIGSFDYPSVLSQYDCIPEISFDYGVVEKASSVGVIAYGGIWKDLGTWNTLTEEMLEETTGECLLGENCNNVHVINELGLPLLALGLSNVVIAATHDGIFVADKTASSFNKAHVEQIAFERPMKEERRWGFYEVVNSFEFEEDRKFLIKTLHVRCGEHLSYQKHSLRTEIWFIANGTGVLLLNGEVRVVKTGDQLTIPAGSPHSILAQTDLCVIEIQMGASLIEDDIERLPFPENEDLRTYAYNRNSQ